MSEFTFEGALLPVGLVLDAGLELHVCLIGDVLNHHVENREVVTSLSLHKLEHAVYIETN